MTILFAVICASAGQVASPVALVDELRPGELANPAPVFWPGYFWMWNGPLEPDVIRAQLRDMASHGARSVCMLPMPHGFRPDSTNNEMAPDYLTPEFFDRVKLAVDEAARLGMNWWLYDEGGWPSGQALGKVTEGHPELRQHRLVRTEVTDAAKGQPWKVPEDALALVVEGPESIMFRPGETWLPQTGAEKAFLYRVSEGGYADLLSGAATRRFIELTHEQYKAAVGAHFGKTIRFTFTDEPSAPNLQPPKSISWTPGMDRDFLAQSGHDLLPELPLLFTPPGPDAPPEIARARVDFYDLWTGKFRDNYFNPIRDWCRANAICAGGHLNGEDETVNAVRHGFGHALRQLRAMDVPGVDLIWRQLWPGRENQHFFPKYASSAAHQNGTRFAFTESFCVYGNGLTPAQMKWLVDYQYIRGLNLLVSGCYPLTTRDHHMTGERPHFGPMNPLWDHLPGFHEYVARMGYLLSVGKPHIKTALYYPVRDLWALGESANEAGATHDALAQELLAQQRDFDLIDDDLIEGARIEGKELVAGAMAYGTIVCGATRWMEPTVTAKLKQFAEAGGRVVSFDASLGIEKMASQAEPTAMITPPNRGIRAAARMVNGAKILVLFNEGNAAYAGEVAGMKYRIDLVACRQIPASQVELLPGETAVLTDSDLGLQTLQPRDFQPWQLLDVAATPRRQFIVGEHDFEIRPCPPAKNWPDSDFSGEVDYTARIMIDKPHAGVPLMLETGPIEYAATVLLDGQPIGHMLWAPWRLELPPLDEGAHTLTVRVANTLANELTSERVTALWAEKKGPGWPSPYHQRAIVFEKESRGGGIQGAIKLLAACP
jgi:hypothetical protein